MQNLEIPCGARGRNVNSCDIQLPTSEGLYAKLLAGGAVRAGRRVPRTRSCGVTWWRTAPGFAGLDMKAGSPLFQHPLFAGRCL